MAAGITKPSREELANIEPTSQAPVFTPRFDIVETEHELTLYGDLPGVKENQLDVRYENEQIIVRGKVTRRDEGNRFLRQEYGIGDFERTFSVVEPVDAAKITAELCNGVLILRLPKSEEAKPRRIAVKSVLL